MIEIVNLPELQNTFMMVFKTNRLSVCDKLVDYWKVSIKNPGVIYSSANKDGDTTVDLSTKDSMDVSIPYNNDSFSIMIFQEYNDHILQSCVEKYIQKYPYCNNGSPWSVKEIGNIQYYKPGSSFKRWHCERSSADPTVSLRHLVFMTYLNDINDTDEYHGGTEWLHQNIKIRARKGYTVIWPADWTHTHRGIVSPNKEKFIITGWLSYIR